MYKMASCDEPGTTVPHQDGEQNEGQVRDAGVVSVDEGRVPCPNPDLGPNSPSFVHDNPFALATPSGEVLFRRPTRYEHVGEPAENYHAHSVNNTMNIQSRSNETEELRKQISSIQASLSAITTRLDNQTIGPETVNTQHGHLPVRSASMPSHFPSRMPIIQNSNDINDRTATALGRERSLSPYRYASGAHPYFPNTGSATVSSGNRSIDYIKVAMYDGKSSWKDYFVQFELAAQANKWDKNMRAIRLACSLRGSAQALLSDLTPEIRQGYDRLVTILMERFEPQNQCEIYKAQMKQRIRKRDEGLPELAQDIKRLTRMAYPSAFLDLRDTLSKDCFIEALNDADMELFICQKEPETLDDAVRMALKFEAFSQGRRKRLSAAKTGVRMQYEDDTPNLMHRNEAQEIRNDIRELKTSVKAQPDHGNPVKNNKGACFNCGETSHFVRSCPYIESESNLPPSDNNNRRQKYISYRAGYRDGQFNANKNQSTESTVIPNNNRFQQNSRPNRHQGNFKKLMPRVRPQL